MTSRSLPVRITPDWTYKARDGVAHVVAGYTEERGAVVFVLIPQDEASHRIVTAGIEKVVRSLRGNDIETPCAVVIATPEELAAEESPAAFDVTCSEPEIVSRRIAKGALYRGLLATWRELRARPSS